MPKIATYTAQTGPGVINTPNVSRDSFGGQAFDAISNLGQGFTEVGKKTQHSQDQLDIAKVTSDYEVGLDEVKTKVAKEPDLSKQKDLFAEETKALKQTILENNPNLSTAVATTFEAHTSKVDGAAAIDIAHAASVLRIQRANADFSRTQERLIRKAALAPTLDEADQHLLFLDELRRNMVRNGLMNPADEEKSHDAAENTYWSIVAQTDPNRILEMQKDQLEAQASGKGGLLIAGMDQHKLNQYVNTAVNTLHLQQSQKATLDKQAEDAIKAAQEENSRIVTADLLENKPLAITIPTLLRSRGLTDNDGRTLADLQAKLASAPDLSKYQRGLAATTEASLTQMKYDNKPLTPEVQANITDDYMRDRINKDEYGHLMSVYQNVNDYKHQSGKENANQDVGHANANLKHELRTSGPADKYDALSEQTIVSADQFFWRKMAQKPDADPWAIAKEASSIFKPVIEKRLGLSTTDKTLLNDANKLALRQRGALSKIEYDKWHDQEQKQRAELAVQETLKALPPPPQPGFFERLFQQKKERKPAGVMGE